MLVVLTVSKTEKLTGNVPKLITAAAFLWCCDLVFRCAVPLVYRVSCVLVLGLFVLFDGKREERLPHLTWL